VERVEKHTQPVANRRPDYLKESQRAYIILWCPESNASAEINKDSTAGRKANTHSQKGRPGGIRMAGAGHVHGQYVGGRTHSPQAQLRRSQTLGASTEVLVEHMRARYGKLNVAIRAYTIPHSWPDAVR